MAKSNILILILFLGLVSCEDVIEVDSGFESSTLVVDAWIDNLERPQMIRLTQSQDYFDNSFTAAVTNAEVSVEVNGRKYDFVSDGEGNYTWTPSPDEVLGQVGEQFLLTINHEGKTYQGTSIMNRVPEIDSIAQVYEEEQLGFPEGNYAELIAKDFTGIGDTYWIKTWKNGEYLNKPQEIVLAYDATFDAGSGLDGVTFIFPIRRGLNPIPDDVDNIDDLPPPYEPGDSIYVELLAINNEAFRFMQIAFEQMTNGDNGIFALPIANTKGNVVEVATGEPILGMFNISAISTATKIIK